MQDEFDLVVVLWANRSGERGRIFETVTREGSRNPVVWNYTHLKNRYWRLIPQATLVYTEAQLREHMSEPLLSASTPENPLLVPVQIVREVLGWTKFDRWDSQ